MEVLVVFLPLLAFLVAGSIALFGGPKAEPAAAGHGSHGHCHDDHGHAQIAHAHDDHSHHISHDELDHAHDDAHDDHHVVAGPPTVGDRVSQFVTAGAVIVSAILSWICSSTSPCTVTRARSS